MPRRARIQDVAVAARVSIKTVSRVLNGVPTVDPVMRRRVEQAVAALEYVPSPTARSLRTGSGTLVGVVVDSIDDPFFAKLVSAVEDRALRAGLDVLVASTRFDVARERQQLLRLTGQRARGVIFAPVGGDLAFLEPHRATMPVVAVDRPVAGYDSVVVDDYGAARGGVGSLVAAGHARIAFLGYDGRFRTAVQRRAAYEDVLRENGVTLDPKLVPEVPFASDAARGALRAVLGLPDPPTALFLANARHATTVVSAVHELGRTDLAMVAFGDFTLADAVRPAITCIDQDPYLMGALGFERLMELVDEPDLPPEQRRVPTGFIERSSHALRPQPAEAAPAAATPGV